MEPNFVQNTFVQAVVQDKRTNKILRISTINETAYKKMQDEKVVYLCKNGQEELLTGRQNCRYLPQRVRRRRLNGENK